MEVEISAVVNSLEEAGQKLGRDIQGKFSGNGKVLYGDIGNVIQNYTFVRIHQTVQLRKNDII